VVAVGPPRNLSVASPDMWESAGWRMNGWFQVGVAVMVHANRKVLREHQVPHFFCGLSSDNFSHKSDSLQISLQEIRCTSSDCYYHALWRKEPWMIRGDMLMLCQRHQINLFGLTYIDVGIDAMLTRRDDWKVFNTKSAMPLLFLPLKVADRSATGIFSLCLSLSRTILHSLQYHPHSYMYVAV